MHTQIQKERNRGGRGTRYTCTQHRYRKPFSSCIQYKNDAFLRPFLVNVIPNHSAFFCSYFRTFRSLLALYTFVCVCGRTTLILHLLIVRRSSLCMCAVLQEDLQILFFLPFQFNFHFFCSVVCFLFILFCCVSFSFLLLLLYRLSPMGQFFPFMWQLWSIGAYIND